MEDLSIFWQISNPHISCRNRIYSLERFMDTNSLINYNMDAWLASAYTTIEGETGFVTLLVGGTFHYCRPYVCYSLWKFPFFSAGNHFILTFLFSLDLLLSVFFFCLPPAPSSPYVKKKQSWFNPVIWCHLLTASCSTKNHCFDS